MLIYLNLSPTIVSTLLCAPYIHPYIAVSPLKLTLFSLTIVSTPIYFYVQPYILLSIPIS